MIENLPDYISWLFILTTVVTFLFFVTAVRRENSLQGATLAGFVLMVWLITQTIITWKGFYLDTTGFPPRFLFLAGPPLVLMILLFITKSGRHFIDSLSLPVLTHMHFVRIFVEAILYWLCIYKLVPQLMTFEGRNFDIIAGITAPIIAYLVFIKRKLGRKALLAWNIICLLLLINIVINAVFSVPSDFQKFGFEQPNIAILYFPFSLLPGFIVPVILFAHLVAIRRLLRGELDQVNKATSKVEASMLS